VSGLGRVRDKQEPRCLRVGKMRERRHPSIVAVAHKDAPWRTLKVPEILVIQNVGHRAFELSIAS
jgi:hypothetical protein